LPISKLGNLPIWQLGDLPICRFADLVDEKTKSSCGMVLHGEFFIDILTHWLIITIFVV